MAAGVLDEKSAARQLLGAGVIDLFAIYVLTIATAPWIKEQLRFLRADYGTAAIFFAFLALFWVLSDALLAGHTPGRLAFGLSMRTTSGQRPSFMRRLMRGLTKLSMLGLAGLRWDRAAGYDRLAKVCWCSPMSPVLPGTAENWRLRFAAGPYAGNSIALTRLAGFAERREIRVGRDRAWANLPIDDPSISKRQCRLRATGNRIEIMDGGDGQSGSTNGTFLGARRLPVGKWVPWDSAQPLRIGKSVVHIDNL